MTISQGSTQLLFVLCRYDTETVYTLVKEVLVSWGYILVDNKVIDDPRWPSDHFWYRLNRKNFSVLSERERKETMHLSSVETVSIAKELVSDLLKLSLEDAIDKFTNAAYEWMCICDLRAFLRTNESEKDAMLRMCKFWGADLGVD